MEPLPKRASLIHETAHTLKAWISRGLLSDVLPGELQLKARLGVGRDTLRQALKILEDDGWVSLSSKGQQRRVLGAQGRQPSDSDTDPSGLPVTLLEDQPISTRVTLLELEDTERDLSRLGLRLRFVSPRIFQLRTPGKALERLVRSHPSSAWILNKTTEPIQRWFAESGLPTLIYGLPFPGVNLPFVGSDWGAAAFHAGLQLMRAGHWNVGFVEKSDPSPGTDAARAGLKRALVAFPDQGTLVSIRSGSDPEAVVQAMEQAWSRPNRPTALVCTSTNMLLSIYSWLTQRGIRVPGELSLVSLANDTWLARLCPSLHHYEPDTRQMSKAISQRVLDLVQSGRVCRDSIQIPLHHVPGQTISRPTPPRTT
jgi:hypothetical protein